MKTVGAFEAKTHLGQLLQEVERGERIAITKRGKQIAMLVPAQAEEEQMDIESVFDAMDKIHEQVASRGMTLKEIKLLKDKGRA